MTQSENKKVLKSKALGGEGGVEFDISFDDPATEIGITTKAFPSKKEKILAGIELTFYNGQVRTGSFYDDEEKTTPLELKTLSLGNDAIKSIKVKQEKHKVFVDANNLGITHIRIETVKGEVLSSVDKSDNDGWVALTDEDGLPIKNVQLIGMFGHSGIAIDKLGVYVS